MALKLIPVGISQLSPFNSYRVADCDVCVAINSMVQSDNKTQNLHWNLKYDRYRHLELTLYTTSTCTWWTLCTYLNKIHKASLRHPYFPASGKEFGRVSSPTHWLNWASALNSLHPAYHHSTTVLMAFVHGFPRRVHYVQ